VTEYRFFFRMQISECLVFRISRKKIRFRTVVFLLDFERTKFRFP